MVEQYQWLIIVRFHKKKNPFRCSALIQCKWILCFIDSKFVKWWLTKCYNDTDNEEKSRKAKVRNYIFSALPIFLKKKRKNLVSYRIINIAKVHTRAVSTSESAMFSSPGSIFSYTLIICIPETVPSKFIGALYRKIKKG